MVKCGPFYKQKTEKSLAFFIMNAFSKWIESSELSHMLTNDIKKDAFDLIKKQTNFRLTALVVKTYKITDLKELFLDYIKSLLEKGNYVQVG